MKNYFIFFSLFFLSIFNVNGQDSKKNIYITLDISWSMSGVKYAYGNYASQVLSTVNKGDNVYLIIGAKEIKLTKIKSIQKSRLNFNGITEIDDVKKFNDIFDDSKKNQELIIIGDGIWGNHFDIKENFKKHVNSGNLRVSFLETLGSKSTKTNFEKFLNDEGIANIYKTDDEKSIFSSLNKIIEETSGIKRLEEYEIKGNCFVYKSKYPVKKLTILYQSKEKLKNLPKLIKTTINGKEEEIKLNGEPTISNFTDLDLSSRIYTLDKEIAPNSEIKVCFDKEINKNDLYIFPVTNVEINGIKIVTNVTKTDNIDVNTVAVCKDRKKAIVKISISGVDANNISKDTKIFAIVGNKKYTSKYNAKGNTFDIEIPLENDTIKYRIESIIGNKRINSGIKKIIKSKDCKPIKPKPKEEVVNINDQYIGDINFGNNKGGCDNIFKFNIIDEQTHVVLSPSNFDIEVDNNYKYLFKKVKAKLGKDNSVILELKSRGFWCPCFVPDSLKIKYRIIQKKGVLISNKVYNIKSSHFIVKINKGNQTWFDKCGWLLYILFGAGMLLIYLITLIKKKRFKRGGKITIKTPSVLLRGINKKYNENIFKLRKRGFAAWLNRWFNPFVPENVLKTFQNIGNHKFRFYATVSPKYILFNKKDFKPGIMSYFNFDPDSKDDKVKFDNNSELTITHNKSGAGKVDNYMIYSYPAKTWNDIAYYRSFLTIISFILTMVVILSVILILISLT